MRRGWTRTTLGELIPLTYGKALTEKDRIPGPVPVIGSSGIVGTHAHALTSGPTLVVGRKGNVGQPHLSAKPCWPIDTVYFYEATEGTDLRFPFYLLEYKSLRRLDRSTAVPGLSRDDYDRVEVDVPPLLEQGRIVEAIESHVSRLDVAVTSLERAQAKLKAYRSSVLKAAVEGRLVPTEAELARSEKRDYESAHALLQRVLADRRRRWEATALANVKLRGNARRHKKSNAPYPKPVAAEGTALPSLPVGWSWATVEQLAADEENSLCDGPFGSHLKTSHYTASGPRVVRLQNIGDGEFVDAEAHISEAHFERLRKHQVRLDDVVVASLGTDVPRACMIPGMLGPAIVKADCIRFSVDPSLADPVFIMHALNAPDTRKRTEVLVHGVGRPRIGLTLIREIPLPIPPLEEQRRIVERIGVLLSVATAVSVELDHQIRRTIRLRQSCLKWAFEGKLVDQMPNEEPAERLLKRIRAERAASPPMKFSRRRVAKAAR